MKKMLLLISAATLIYNLNLYAMDLKIFQLGALHPLELKNVDKNIKNCNVIKLIADKINKPLDSHEIKLIHAGRQLDPNAILADSLTYKSKLDNFYPIHIVFGNLETITDKVNWYNEISKCLGVSPEKKNYKLKVRPVEIGGNALHVEEVTTDTPICLLKKLIAGDEGYMLRLSSKNHGLEDNKRLIDYIQYLSFNTANDTADIQIIPLFMVKDEAKARLKTKFEQCLAEAQAQEKKQVEDIPSAAAAGAGAGPGAGAGEAPATETGA